MNTKMPEVMQANTEKTDPQIFSDINCKHLGLIVLSDRLILAGNLMCA